MHEGAKHPKWNVPIVVLPCKDGSIVVTYSEMNTLPDLFGNPEAIRQTPKKQVLALLQGVRQQLYIELDNLKAAGDAGLFAKASTFGARAVEKTGILGAKGGISAKGALNLGAIEGLGEARARLEKLKQQTKKETGHDGNGF